MPATETRITDTLYALNGLRNNSEYHDSLVVYFWVRIRLQLHMVLWFTIFH